MKSTKPSSEDLDELRDHTGALYGELEKLAKKDPRLSLSDLATGRVNRLIGEARLLVAKHDRYVGQMEPFLAAGENPEVRDALLVLTEIRVAIGRVRAKLGYDELEFDL